MRGAKESAGSLKAAEKGRTPERTAAAKGMKKTGVTSAHAAAGRKGPASTKKVTAK